MAIYEFKNTETDEVYEKQMTIADMEQYLKDNPTHIRHHSSAASMGDPVRLGLRKQDNGFREVLQKISERTPGAKGLKDHIR
jgi:hypothetical protein